jgi:flagellar biosynthesis/type III secretory pathway protein FliH
MDHKEPFRAFLSTAYKMTAGDIDSILNESGEDQAKLVKALTDKHAARVAEIAAEARPPEGQTFKDGVKKGFKDAFTSLEKSIRDEYEIESTATGIDLVKEVIAAKATASGTPAKLDDEEVKKHPVYQQLEKQSKKQLADTAADWEKKFTDRELEIKKSSTLTTVQQKALDLRNSLQPVISGNAKIAANTEKGFLSRLGELEYTVNDDGSIIMQKDGKVLTDKMGHTMQFDDYVKELSGEYYEFKANNGGSNGGNGGQGQSGTGGNAGAGGAGGGNYQKPKTIDELFKVTRDKNGPIADRLKVQAEWDAEHPEDV